MAKRENILPYAVLGQLIGEATGKRVSDTARVAAERILDELTEKIMKKAILLADHSGRKTVKSKDIALAYKQVRGD